MQVLGWGAVSRPMSSYFTDIKDVELFVPHTAMWSDPKMVEEIEENGQFN